MIESIKQFFHVVLHSCYDLEFYRIVRARPLGRAFGYAVVLVLLISLYFGLAIVLPGTLKFSDGLATEIAANLPDGTTLSVQDGKFDSSLPAGTEIALDDDFAVVLDPSLEGNEFPRAFEDRAGVFVGRDALFLRGAEGSREVTDLTGVPDFSVTRETAVEKVQKWKWTLSLGLAALAIAGRFAGGFLALLLDSLLVALLALLLGRIWRLQLSYRQWLAVGLHAATLPILIDTIAGSLSVHLPFVSTAIYLLVVLTVAMDERSRPTKKGVLAPSVARQESK